MKTENTEKSLTSPPPPAESLADAAAAAAPQSPPPPPSLTTSPAHEFSFTISLHPSAATSSLKLTKPAGAAPPPDFDLSPADEIFFHGHLLPLHLISHRETEQKKSTTTNLPAAAIPSITTITAAAAAAGGCVHANDFKNRTKPKSFPSFFAIRKWIRRIDDVDGEKQRISKKKKTTHIVRLWKKYTSFVDPLLFFKSGKDRREVRRNSHSFSGDSNARDGVWKRRWRGGSSAPASMRTSPANSGLLVAPSSAGAFSSSDESTMEELQNAIQAAIAHCKNSIAVKEE